MVSYGDLALDYHLLSIDCNEGMQVEKRWHCCWLLQLNSCRCGTCARVQSGSALSSCLTGHSTWCWNRNCTCCHPLPMYLCNSQQSRVREIGCMTTVSMFVNSSAMLTTNILQTKNSNCFLLLFQTLLVVFNHFSHSQPLSMAACNSWPIFLAVTTTCPLWVESKSCSARQILYRSVNVHCWMFDRTNWKNQIDRSEASKPLLYPLCLLSCTVVHSANKATQPQKLRDFYAKYLIRFRNPQEVFCTSASDVNYSCVHLRKGQKWCPSCQAWCSNGRGWACTQWQTMPCHIL